MNNIEKQIPLENNVETLKLPGIRVQEEKGATLLSVLLRGYKPDWGSQEHELSRDVDEFFEQNPLDEKSIQFLERKKALDNNGVDEEVLYNIAMTHDRPERIESLFEFISKYKDYIDSPQELRESVTEILSTLDYSLPEELKTKFQKETRADINLREKNINETRNRIKNLIDFFKPKADTTTVRNITIMPTDFLFKKESGSAYQFNNELILRSNIDNPHNLEHEFLHSVINPIVDKLSEKLTEEQKQKISRFASNRLKDEENYGQGYYSLLCEEFIRTYNDVFQQNERPLTYEDFVQKIENVSEEQFNTQLEKRVSFKNRCAQLQITTLDDFKNKSQKYFDAFEKNDLRNIIFEFYQDYVKEKEDNENIGFEKFVLKEFNNRI